MPVTRTELSQAIAQLMPRIIQGVQLEFLVKRTLTQTQFLVLVAIHSRGSCPMSGLANNMHVSLPTMSGIVERLVEKGYVQRVEDKEDRRKVVVELSKSGKEMISQFQGAVSRRWNEVLKNLGQQDIEAFYAVIAKLTAQLKGER